MARTDARGLTLAARKDAAASAPLRSVPAPAIAVLALDQGRGRAARPVVRVGDAVRVGTRIADADDSSVPALHASVAGRVIAIEERPTPTGTGPCIVIENDGSDAREREPEALDWAALEPAALVAALREAGVAGLGGAAYATAAKLDAARTRAAGHLMLNGAECEPWICCDDALMRSRALDVIEGARALMHATGATRCSVAIEDDKPEAIAAMQAAIAAAADSRCALVTLPTRYPAGAEGPLVAALTGIEVPRGGHPPDVGALCHNVGTAAAVAAAVRGDPLVRRIVTVTGSGVVAPANLEARLGTPIADLVAACGGYADAPLRLIAGGSMMGRALDTDAVPVTHALSCALVATAGDLVPRGPEYACIRCGDCADICPPGLLPQQLLRGLLAGDEAMLARHGLADCIECGCCDYVCPSAIPLTARFRAARADARARDAARRQSDDLRERHARHVARLAAEAEAERRAFEAARQLARGRKD